MAVESEFTFRNEMVFNYIQLLIFEGMKVTYKSMPDGRSIGLIVAGDVAYNGVHLYVAETNAETRSSR